MQVGGASSPQPGDKRLHEGQCKPLRSASAEPQSGRPPEASVEATSDHLPEVDTSRSVTEPAPVGKPGQGTPSPAAKVKPDLLPRAFGRYEVRQILGTGAFGIVYLGHDTQLDRPVAIKVLRADSGQGQETVGQFLKEAQRVARLRHPGIVAVHDIGVQAGKVYIVSDYIQGVSLRQWLETQRPTWQEAARITAALADALAHAHAQLTVHRDVKPGNILLTAERQPVLVDFGLGTDESEAGRDRGAAMGTPRYMSPEQFAGAAHRIDGRTDIYSLGVVLYEMLCGLLPFRAREVAELTRQVCDDEVQPPRQIVPDLPRELERICLKALAKRVKDRYTTATDFAADLRMVLAQSASGPPRETAGNIPMPASAAGQAPASPRGKATTIHRSIGSTAYAVRRTRGAERRQVTILVCGCAAFDSEQYVENLDDEDKIEVLSAFQQTCDEPIKRSEGITLQATDEAVVACFGYPVAQEDAARRAARAALGILEGAAKLNQKLQRKYQLMLAPWVGIHTGSAVAETTSDNVVSVVGEARDIAARLDDVAEPGAIVCTDATRRLIRGYFVCESLGRRKIKGASQPVAIHRVKGESGARTAIDVALPVGLTPLTGRDHEVGLLKDRWERAQEGMGQIVLIVGEAGLGKSRLVYTMKQYVAGERASATDARAESEAAPVSRRSPASAVAGNHAPIVEWRCSRQAQNSGLFPAVDFFERHLAFDREESPADKFTRLVSSTVALA
jgi:class 3 adenylate cyclase